MCTAGIFFKSHIQLPVKTVLRGPENDCKGNWDKKHQRNASVIQAYVLLSQSVRSAGKDFSRFASTIKSDNGAVLFVGIAPLSLSSQIRV